MGWRDLESATGSSPEKWTRQPSGRWAAGFRALGGFSTVWDQWLLLSHGDDLMTVREGIHG
jgi:hypothetical protein